MQLNVVYQTLYSLDLVSEDANPSARNKDEPSSYHPGSCIDVTSEYK